MKERRLRRAAEPFVSMITYQASEYQRLLARAPDVRSALETVGDATDEWDLERRLLELGAFEKRIPHSHYRMEWVSKGWNASALVLARAKGLSVEEADKQLQSWRSRICSEVGTSPIQVLLGGAPADSVTVAITALVRALARQ